MCAFSRDCIGTGKANMYVEKTDLHMVCFSDTVLESVTAMCRILFFCVVVHVFFFNNQSENFF